MSRFSGTLALLQGRKVLMLTKPLHPVLPGGCPTKTFGCFQRPCWPRQGHPKGDQHPPSSTASTGKGREGTSKCCHRHRELGSISSTIFPSEQPAVPLLPRCGKSRFRWAPSATEGQTLLHAAASAPAKALGFQTRSRFRSFCGQTELQAGIILYPSPTNPLTLARAVVLGRIQTPSGLSAPASRQAPCGTIH